MIYAGIDPGISGSLTFLSEYEDFYEFYSFRKYNYKEIFTILQKRKYDIKRCAMEKIFPRPHDAQRLKKFWTMAHYHLPYVSFLDVLDIKTKLVIPQTWQFHMQCLTKGVKSISCNKAKELFPHFKGITQVNSDSLILAKYIKDVGIDKIESSMIQSMPKN